MAFEQQTTGGPGDAVPAALRQRRAPDALREALKLQLRGVVDKELSPAMLVELEQTAALARKMLIVAGDPRAIGGRRRGGGVGMLNTAYGGYGAMVGASGMDDVIGPDDLEGVAVTGALAPAPYAENFGAESLRNLVADANQPKIADLMNSLDIAQHMKDGAGDEIAKRLRAQIDERLGIEPAPAPDPVRRDAGGAPMLTEPRPDEKCCDEGAVRAGGCS